MRLLPVLLGLTLLPSLGFSKTLETVCHGQDCFRHGWTTTEAGTSYELVALCTEDDCAGHGWRSEDTEHSTYDVTCKTGGCFTEGWYSTQRLNGLSLYDEVTCRDSACLVFGWDVVRSSDGRGGSVTCGNNDCSRFGGYSYWRGKTARTTCYQSDCYRFGWKLEIEE